MNTKSILAETIISGFFYLVVIIMLLFYLLDVNDAEKLFSIILSISTGASAIILTMVFGVSFFLGSLAYRIWADVSSWFVNKEFDITKNASEVNKKEYYSSWITKSFFRSTAASGLFILILALLLDCKYREGSDFVFILIIGSVIELLTIIAFKTQRDEFLEKRTALKNSE